MLLDSRNKISTDPRDKVYGIAGLTAARDDPRFIVDYSHTVFEVYRDVVKYVVTATQNLEIISSGKGEVHPDWLPSWAPDWSQSTETGCSLIRFGGFNAALGKAADATFDSSGRVLQVRGTRIGIIQSVAMLLDIPRVWMSYKNHNFYLLLCSICSWHELAKIAPGDEAYRLKAFQDVIWMEPYADREIENLGARILKSLAVVIEHYMPKYPIDDILHDSLLRWQTKVREQDRLAKVKEACHYLCSVADWVNGRRFFLSSSRQMGLAPYRAEAGDKVCVLFGSSYPVILRPQEGYHTVVGDAYVHGIMYGEAMEGLSDGKYTI